MDTYIVRMIDGDMISIEATNFRMDHDKNYVIFETESNNGAYFNTNNIVGFWNADLVQGIFSKPVVKLDLKTMIEPMIEIKKQV